MNKSYQVFRLFGISIRIHFSFPVLLILGLLIISTLPATGPRMVVNAFFITTVIFLFLLLHEIGHGLIAKYYQIEVQEIVLLPIGGMAKLARYPEEPRQEIAIAAAGPLVNLAVALVLLISGVVMNQVNGMRISFPLRYDFSQPEIGGILGYLVVVNLALAIFNLIPAFPLDGGRILRAALATRLEYESATRLAAVFGQMVAMMIGFWGILNGAILFIVTGVFLFLISRKEDLASGFQEQISAVTVGEIMKEDYIPLQSHSFIKDACLLSISSNQKAIPVIERNFYLGTLTQKGMLKALEERNFYRMALKFIRTDIQVASRTDRVIDIQTRLSANDLDILPVVENGRYLGVVTIEAVRNALSLKYRKDSIVRDSG